MKRVFTLSLVGGILVAVFWWKTRHQTHKPDEVGRLATRSELRAIPPHPRRTPSLITNQPAETLWAAIDSGDLRSLVSDLREIGCPEQTIRDLVTFRVCRAYRNRQIEVETRLLIPLGYTKLLDPASAQERRLKEREFRAAVENDLETLLGVSAEKLRASVVGWPEPDENFLPLEKRKQARELTERYQRMIEEAREEGGGFYGFYGDPKVDAKVEKLNQRKEAELAQLLTAYELEESRLRSSPAALYVLEHLPEAGSESEFRTMMRVVQEVGIAEPRTGGNRYGLGPQNEDGHKEREFAEKQARLEMRLMEVLGEARFAEMQSAEQKRQAEEN